MCDEGSVYSWWREYLFYTRFSFSDSDLKALLRVNFQNLIDLARGETCLMHGGYEFMEQCGVGAELAAFGFAHVIPSGVMGQQCPMEQIILP